MRRLPRRAVWTLGAGALIITVLVVTGAGTDPRLEAWQACCRAVSEFLQFPEQAGFVGDSTDLAAAAGDGSYRVHGYVDAATAGAGRARSFFACTVREESSGTWIVEELTEMGRAVE